MAMLNVNRKKADMAQVNLIAEQKKAPCKLNIFFSRATEIIKFNVKV